MSNSVEDMTEEEINAELISQNEILEEINERRILLYKQSKILKTARVQHILDNLTPETFSSLDYDGTYLSSMGSNSGAHCSSNWYKGVD